MATVLTFGGGARRQRRNVTDFWQEWIVLPREAALRLSKHREFTGETLRVFLAMLGMMDKANHLKIRIVDVAEHLGIHPSQVARQIRLMEEKEVLLPRRLYGWRLNPNYGFMGEPDKSLRRAPGGEIVLVD